MTTQSIQLLGTLDVTWAEGSPPRFRSPRAQALLGYLAVERRPIARDLLAALFWPDKPLDEARTGLRRELHNLASVLPGCWDVNRKTAEFTPTNNTRIDLEEFKKLAGQGQWPEAAELIRGEFLEGIYLNDNLEFESWLLGEQERWRQRGEDVLLRAIEAKQQNGEIAHAKRYLTRLFQFVPWHENGRRQMMRLMAQTGDYNGAIAQYDQCRAILEAELGLEPAPETTALFKRIQHARQRISHHNLPPQPTIFIGREEELAQLRRLLAHPERRLITLAGPGGVGKTRLAIETTKELATTFLEGVVYVSLTAVETGTAFASALAEALQLQLQGHEKPASQIINYLRKQEILLVLDNFEQLINDMDLLLAIFAEVPTVTLLVTSRERLNLNGEWVITVAGLDYPPDEKTAAFEAYDAVRLFDRSARQVQSDYSLSIHREAVARICRLVEGMPLALEMSAAWVMFMETTDIATEIDRGLDLLATEARNVPNRHRSIQAVFNSSWQRLDEKEQQVLRQLAVFRGGFFLEAARGVTVPKITLSAIKILLAKLETKSLIRFDPATKRYDLHELIRQFVWEKITTEAAEQLRNRHLTYYTQFAEQIAPALHSTKQKEAIKQLKPETGNFQAALDWSIHYPESALYGLRLAIALDFFWVSWGNVLEDKRLIETLINLAEHTASPSIKAWAFLIAAEYEMYFQEGDSAYSFLKRSLQLCYQVEEEALLVRVLINLGNMERRRKNWNVAMAYLQESLSITPDDIGRANTLLEMGRLAYHQHHWPASTNYAKQSLTLFRRVGDSPGQAAALYLLGKNAIQEQNISLAKQYLAEARQHFQDNNLLQDFNQVDMINGELSRIEGNYQLAIQYFRETVNFFEQSGMAYFVALNLTKIGLSLIQLGDLTEAVETISRSLSMFNELNNMAEIANSLSALGGAAVALGEPERAARLLGAAETFFAKTNTKLKSPDREEFAAFIEDARQQLGNEVFTAVWAEGGSMSLEQAVAYGLESVV